MNEHEQGLIDSFIHRDRKERWRTLLASPRGRSKLRTGFAHTYDFDGRWAVRLPTSATAQSISSALRAKGAGPACYALSEDDDLDGQEWPLDEALERVIGGGFGTYLSCLPGKLAFFESEEVGMRFILERNR